MKQRLLTAYKDALDAGAKALIEKEVLFAEDVDDIITRHPPTDLPPWSNGSSGSSENGGPPDAAVPVGAAASGSSSWP
jgi:hypothetical protein